MRVAIVDYGLGNIKSVLNSVSCFPVEVYVAQTGEELADAQRIILPGVGAFDAGMKGLRDRGQDTWLNRLVNEQGVPCLGICLGMQLLLEGSEEGEVSGLGWFKGRVRRFSSAPGAPKVPHMGWSTVAVREGARLFHGLNAANDFYFVHSYYVPLDGEVGTTASGVCDYGLPFAAAIERGNVHAVQFHPEKSQLAGLKLIEKFLGQGA